MYENFSQFQWANYNRPDTSFAETDRNYTNTYRNIAARLAGDFVEKGDNKKAKEVLDKVMEMIPDEPRYDYGTATERIAQLYNEIGETEKANQLLNTIKLRLLEKINYYENLSPNLRYTISSDLSSARSDYSIMIYGQVKTYLEKTDTTAAMKFFQSEFAPVRNNLIQSYQTFKSDGEIDLREQSNIDGQFRFISELLGIADLIDSTYAENQTDELYRILTNEK